MVKEVELYRPLLRLFRDMHPTLEVPLGPKRIDLLFTSDDLNEVVAVEVKVRNWKGALKQALVYQICADESYVAMYEGYYGLVNRDKFERLGIGLILVSKNRSARVAILAKPSPRRIPNHSTLVRAFVAEKRGINQSKRGGTIMQTSPFKFYLWYVANERQYYEAMAGCYDGFIVNAHILEHNASAFSALTAKISKPFFVIPDTNFFQFAQSDIFSDGKGGIRSSWEKLAASYGSLMQSALVRKHNLEYSDFVSAKGSWEQPLHDLVERVVDFQKEKVPGALKGLERFFDKPVKKGKVDSHLVAPYFYFTSSKDPWYRISLEMVRESVKLKEQHKMFAVLCMSKDMLTSTQEIDVLAEDYSISGLDGILLWIGDFDECRELTPLLYGFKKMVASLKKNGKTVLNIYGGYFSLLLYHYQLDGLASGLYYKEFADPTDFRTGGPAGGPVPKYYMQCIKMNMRKTEAELTIRESDSLKCSCEVCKDQVDQIVDVATPNSVSKDLMRRHLLVVRRAEKEAVTKRSLKQSIDELEDTYKQYESKADIIPIEHLKRWAEALKKK